MRNGEKYIKGYSWYTNERFGTIVVRIKFTDGTWDPTPFKVFDKWDKPSDYDLKHLPIIGRTKADAYEMITGWQQALIYARRNCPL